MLPRNNISHSSLSGCAPNTQSVLSLCKVWNFFLENDSEEHLYPVCTWILMLCATLSEKFQRFLDQIDSSKIATGPLSYLSDGLLSLHSTLIQHKYWALPKKSPNTFISYFRPREKRYFRTVHSYSSRALLCECKSLFSIFSTLIVVSVAPHDRVELVSPFPSGCETLMKFSRCVFS